MQRAISRVIRGTCRKWRESDCPVAAGEEVNRNKEDKHKFVPPKHSWEECVGWTAGLVLGYQLTHRRRQKDDCCTSVSAKACTSTSAHQRCPFAVASKVFSQPTVNSSSTALHVNRKTSSSTVFHSVDLSPFIHDDTREPELPDKLNTSWSSVDDEEEDILFSSEPDLDLPLAPIPINAADKLVFQSGQCSSSSLLDDPAEHGRLIGADLLSVLGAFEFLSTEEKIKAKGAGGTRKSSKKKLTTPLSKNPPIHALDLMKKGAELGSARAMYNIGVAYDRMNDTKLAREYYNKAADLGHPLATYNCAVLALKDGHLTEGYALMKTASDFGVPEAEEYMRPPPNNNPARDSLANQF